MKQVIKTYPITNKIILEVLQIALLSGERYYVTNNNIEPTKEWKQNHIDLGKAWTKEIKSKLKIENNSIRINYEVPCIEVLDIKSEDVNYDNNWDKKIIKRRDYND